MDLKTALASASGDPEFLDELLGIFLRDVPRYFEEARAAMAEEDFDRVGRSAHALRGAAGQLGARALASAAYEVERWALGPAEGRKPMTIDALDKAVGDLLRALGVVRSAGAREA